MFGFLNRYLFYSFFKIFFLIIVLFFPIIFFADVLLSEGFNAYLSLIKVPFRYGQTVCIIALLGSYFGVKSLIYRHGTWIFISLRFKQRDVVLAFLYLSFLLSSVFFEVILPFNEKAFSYKTYSSNWAILIEEKRVLFVYRDDNKEKDDIWEIQKGGDLSHYYSVKSALSSNDFYTIWNEAKKMSLERLEEYQAYLKKNNFSDEDYFKQRHIYYSRFFAIFTMLLCGYVMAWNGSFLWFFFCFLFFNWFDLLAFFLPLKYCVILLWGNIVFWLCFGLLGLL